MFIFEKFQKSSKKNLNQPLKRKVRVTDILAWYVLHLESQIYPNSMMILKFSHSVNIFIISEAEVIKEKVKPAPVKKGMNISEIILYMQFFFPLYDEECIKLHC